MRSIFFPLVFSGLSLLLFCDLENIAMASNARHNSSHSSQNIYAGTVYPQFRSSSGSVIRWLSEQMPLKVYVAHGQTMEKIIDPNMGVAAFNIDNLGAWPDFAAAVIENQQQLAQLPIAEGYVPEHY